MKHQQQTKYNIKQKHNASESESERENEPETETRVETFWPVIHGCRGVIRIRPVLKPSNIGVDKSHVAECVRWEQHVDAIGQLSDGPSGTEAVRLEIHEHQISAQNNTTHHYN